MNPKKPKLMILAALLILINIVAFRVAVDHSVDLVEVPYAKVKIRPRQEIKASMIGIKKVPKAYADSSCYTSKSQVLHKYTEITGLIPKGSLFYKTMIHDLKELPDYPSMQLKKGQTAFSLPSDLVKLSGNTIVEGQKVDIYVTVQKQREQPVVDRLVKNVRVLSIKDRKGLNMDDPNTTGIPYVVILGIRDEIIPYLKIANKIGTIDLYAQTANSKEKEESLFVSASKVLPYLKNE